MTTERTKTPGKRHNARTLQNKISDGGLLLKKMMVFWCVFWWITATKLIRMEFHAQGIFRRGTKSDQRSTTTTNRWDDGNSTELRKKLREYGNGRSLRGGVDTRLRQLQVLKLIKFMVCLPIKNSNGVRGALSLKERKKESREWWSSFWSLKVWKL